MDFVKCSNCHCKTWYDRIKVENDQLSIRFKCVRCGKIINIKGCSVCKAEKWKREMDMFTKGAKKPVVRFRCLKCNRIIGLHLDHDE